MKWLKMGCGHLVALPLLLTSFMGGLFFLSYFGESSLSLGKSMVAGGVAAVTGGLGFGLMHYLWTSVWPASDAVQKSDTEKEPGRTDVASASGAAAASPPEPEARDEPSVSFSVEDETTAEAEETDGPVEADPAEGAAEGKEEQPSRDGGSKNSRLSEDQRPWEVRDEWTDAEIPAERSAQDASSGMGQALLYSPLVMAVGGGIAWLAYTHPPEQWIIPFLIGLSFVAVGVGMIVLGGYRLLRHRRFGETTLEMDTFPGELGGRLCGTLHTGIPVADVPDGGVRVKLTCYRRRVTQKEHGVDVHRTPLWRDEKQVTPRPADEGEGLDVPVGFEIPTDPPASTPARRAERIMWRIEASASLPGVDYASEVEVPVFPVQPDDSVSLERYTRREIEHDEDASLSDGITLRRPSSDRLMLTFGRARQPGRVALVTVLGLALTAGALVTLRALKCGQGFLDPKRRRASPVRPSPRCASASETDTPCGSSTTEMGSSQRGRSG
jgi:hypothetical protein